MSRTCSGREDKGIRGEGKNADEVQKWKSRTEQVDGGVEVVSGQKIKGNAGRSDEDPSGNGLESEGVCLRFPSV